MKQRTPEWHEWRKNKLGSSEAASIMGCGFLSILELFEIKLGIRPPQEENAAMARGIALEDEARQCFEMMQDIDVFPTCLEHPDYPWMGASLDGMTLDQSQAVEIKCPGEKDHAIARRGAVPAKYIPQLQHIMSVAGLKEIFYFSYKDGEGIILVHERDDEYIKELIEKEAEFIRCLNEGRKALQIYEELMDSLKYELCRIIKNDDTAPVIPDI